ncbi:BrnA antitoxin family protein [Shimia abyssi]|uniref:BrnA antitoxin of type II toxin-antitoxin system n=1 Tax=Shimia abyssi TaxID=1662395 RepID=A0A2P8FEK2_9RHOB|nr:BrnA antitoxin family protein [Shimia abyssi]PSL20114.1 BrnA antitoxin of type II toxin-antitoxin system [Shimia abyssi]
MTTRRLSKTQRMAKEKLTRDLIYLNTEYWLPAAMREDVPDAWHTLEQDLDVSEPKEKVTLYLDRSVAKFYRAMGRGYQERINRLLATWAQMKIADELRVDELVRERFDGRPGIAGAVSKAHLEQAAQGLNAQQERSDDSET